MASKLFMVNKTGVKNIDLPQYPDSAWDWTTGEPENDTDLYSTVAAVFRAVNLTANATSALPFQLRRGDEIYDDSQNWQNKVGFMPNPRELIRLWRMSLSMTNKAYGFIEQTKRGKNIRYIAPSTITPKVDEYGLAGFKRTIGSGSTEYPLSAKRIIYMWRMDHTTELLPSPNTEFRAMMAAAGVLYYADKMTAAHFQRGGIKPTMLLVDGVTNPADRDRIENIWDKIVRGSYKYLGKIFQAQKITPVVIGAGIDDMKDNALMRAKIEDIALAMGIPLSLLLANSANYATAQSEYAVWYRESITPWANFMADCLNDQVFTPMGLHMDFMPEMTDPEQEDEVQRAGAYASYVSSGMLPSVAAQIVGIELPFGMEYSELDPKPEPEPEPVADDEPEAAAPVEQVEEPEPEPVRGLTIGQYREIENWRQIAQRKFKRGDGVVFPWTCKELTPEQAALITERLASATSEAEINQAFDIASEAMTADEASELIALADAINRLADKQPDEPTEELPDAE